MTRRHTWTLLSLLLLPGSAFAASLSDVYVGELAGGRVVAIFRERRAGKVLGYLPGEPGSRLTNGLVSRHSLTFDIAGEDAASSFTATFEGRFKSKEIIGAVTFSDGTRQDVRFRSSRTPETVEHWRWLSDPGGAAQAARVETGAGGFYAGSFVALESCDFIACGSPITSWDVAGDAHTIATRSGDVGCVTTGSLTGVFDRAELLVEGPWSATHTCAPATSGTWLGGKEGLASFDGIQEVLDLLALFADRIEEESAGAADAFSDSYLSDGKTKADWERDLSALYRDYGSLDVAIAIRQIVTENDAEVHPRFLLPARIEWDLVVTGVPAAGGLRRTALAIDSRLFADEQLLWIGRDSGAYVFVGNGESGPFRIGMPVRPEDAARLAFGIWPFGVHGGGHPEGHPGWDVEYVAGAFIRAAAEGTVADADFDAAGGDWTIRVTHRPGYATIYSHIASLAPGVAEGAPVASGQALGEPRFFGPQRITHFAVQLGTSTLCPLPFLDASGTATFAALWATAAYGEELTEPYACNPIDVAFPLSRTWTRTAGDLAPQIEFSRVSPATLDYTYRLRDGGGGVTETGTVSLLEPLALPDAGRINLQPAGGGPARLGLYRILDGEMRIAWGATRPADLSGATVYSTGP